MRFIRDGVDQPLAELFVHATRRPAPDFEGAARDRSASETFFFRRLESPPQLAGRFHLNALLPIPFDDRGQMEVEFYCAGCRLVIEIDGGQHLADADAWRRDRRKDAALQAHGCFILRFLAEDLGKRLDMVLDTVLRTLAMRGYQPVGRSNSKAAETTAFEQSSRLMRPAFRPSASSKPTVSRCLGKWTKGPAL